MARDQTMKRGLARIARAAGATLVLSRGNHYKIVGPTGELMKTISGTPKNVERTLKLTARDMAPSKKGRR